MPHFSLILGEVGIFCRRPRAHRPPAIQLLHAIKVDTGNHDRLAVSGSGYDQSEGRCDTAPCERVIDLSESSDGKGSAVFAHQDDVRAVIAKFPLQLGLHVNIEIEHGRCHRSRDHHCEQR